MLFLSCPDRAICQVPESRSTSTLSHWDRMLVPVWIHKTWTECGNALSSLHLCIRFGVLVGPSCALFSRHSHYRILCIAESLTHETRPRGPWKSDSLFQLKEKPFQLQSLFLTDSGSTCHFRSLTLRISNVVLNLAHVEL